MLKTRNFVMQHCKTQNRSRDIENLIN